MENLSWYHRVCKVLTNPEQYEEFLSNYELLFEGLMNEDIVAVVNDADQHPSITIKSDDFLDEEAIIKLHFDPYNQEFYKIMSSTNVSPIEIKAVLTKQGDIFQMIEAEVSEYYESAEEEDYEDDIYMDNEEDIFNQDLLDSIMEQIEQNQEFSSLPASFKEYISSVAMDRELKDFIHDVEWIEEETLVSSFATDIPFSLKTEVFLRAGVLVDSNEKVFGKKTVVSIKDKQIIGKEQIMVLKDEEVHPLIEMIKKYFY